MNNEASNTPEAASKKIHNIPKGGLQFYLTRHVKAFQFRNDGTDDQWVLDQIDEAELNVDGVLETAYYWRDAGEVRIRPGQWVIFDPFLSTTFVVDDAYLKRVSDPSEEEILGLISVLARDMKIAKSFARQAKVCEAAEEAREAEPDKKSAPKKERVSKKSPKAAPMIVDEVSFRDDFQVKVLKNGESRISTVLREEETKLAEPRPWTVIRNDRGHFLGNDMKWHKVPYPGCIFAKGHEVVLMKGKVPKAVPHKGRVIDVGEHAERPTVAQAIEGIVAWDRKYARTIPDREKTSWVYHGRKVSNLKHGTREQMLRQLRERVQLQKGDSILIGSIAKVPYTRIECGDSVEAFLEEFLGSLK